MADSVVTIGRPGRYILDDAGRLHPFRRRYAVRAVAVVNVRALRRGVGNIETPTAGQTTADRAGGCEGRAPEGPSGAAAGKDMASANARQPYAPPECRTKVDLNGVPSAMERLAASWRKGNADV